VSGYVYDTGVLIAGERSERLVWAMHRTILDQGIRPIVPTPVLAQAWRGGPQPQLSRFLVGCEIRVLTEEHARTVGRVLATTGAVDIIDASVVVMAQRLALEVLTSDDDDLMPLAAALGRPRVLIRSLNDLGRN
jgi:hypothetical protein